MNKWIPAVIAVLLAGCSALAPAPTATPAATATPPATPTPTLTPTATPDPSMPEGATGKNGKGEWIREELEGGRTYVWTNIQYGRDTEYGITGHWFESRMADGNDIYLIDKDQIMDYTDLPDLIPMHVYLAVDSALQQTDLFFIHQEDLYQGKKLILGFPWWMTAKLGQRYFDKVGDRDLPDEEWLKVFECLRTGTLTIPFFTSDRSYVWRPSTGRGYKVYLIPWNEAEPTLDSRFFEWHYSSPGIDGRSMTTLDEDGNLVTVIASKAPLDSLTDRQLRALILFPLARVILHKDQSEAFYLGSQIHRSDIYNFTQRSDDGPYFHSVYGP